MVRARTERMFVGRSPGGFAALSSHLNEDRVGPPTVIQSRTTQISAIVFAPPPRRIACGPSFGGSRSRWTTDEALSVENSIR
jgi:hypothetical protein